MERRVLRRLDLIRRLRRERSGQALVEFAIISPLIVMMLLFSIWFYEVVQIKLKVQEAARYAAWEATAHPQHDYKKGWLDLLVKQGTMILSVSAESMLRYQDLNSTELLSGVTPSIDPTALLSSANRGLSAEWSSPHITLVPGVEEMIYGGSVANYIFMVGGALFDLASAANYTSGNALAASLGVAGRAGGWAGASQTVGPIIWGFNPAGQVTSSAMTYVTNSWFEGGVMGFLRDDVGLGGQVLPNPGVSLEETHHLLTDSWRLNDGQSLPKAITSGSKGPGVHKGKAYWEQVNRMYMANSIAKGLLKSAVTVVKGLLDTALQLSGTGADSGLSVSDMVQTALVSRGYSSSFLGMVGIKQDMPTYQFYDTAPHGRTGDGSVLQKYGDTLKDRGEHFMGCKQKMSLGCPSSSLQGDIFGEFINRE